ncbi:MAG: hypothetical protein II937_13870 [Bacteroidales bacterium]|nr:hypothetical protein [Bacteroidales bacterium]
MTEQEKIKLYGIKIYIERKIKYFYGLELDSEHKKDKAAQSRYCTARCALEDVLKQMFGVRLIENKNGE